MKKYIYTQNGLGHLVIEGKEYLMERGDQVELPEGNATVKDWVEFGYLNECAEGGAASVVKEEKNKARNEKPKTGTETNGANATGAE